MSSSSVKVSFDSRTEEGSDVRERSFGMDDERIISLYFARDERAVRETELKYIILLMHAADNVLGSYDEAEEVANDVLLKAWNSIPPEHPKSLGAWLRKITRRAAIDVFRTKSREKRGGSEYDLALSEIAEMASGTDGPEEIVSAKELASLINGWLGTLPLLRRQTFTLRYYDSESVRRIAELTGQTESNVKVTLMRLRAELAEIIRKEGYTI